MSTATFAAHPQDSRLAGLPEQALDKVQQAQLMLQSGRALDASVLLDEALRMAPTHPELLRVRALAFLYGGQPGRAIELLQQALSTWPRDGLIMTQLGAARAQGGDMAGAEAAFRYATEFDPYLVDAWYNLALALELRMDTHGARAAFLHVLEIDPRHEHARVQNAELLKVLGRLDEAEAELRVVLHNDPDAVSAWIGLANLKSFRPDDAELGTLLRLHSSGKVHDSRKGDLAFACAALLEARGRYPEAFALFSSANAVKRQRVQWNAAAFTGLVSDILAVFAHVDGSSAECRRGEEAIFLVGMPRSGSTLAEQILSAHPQVESGGERDDIVQILREESLRRQSRFPYWAADASESDWERLGFDYLLRSRSLLRERPVFTDKTLTNWQTLGAIRRMLPGARLVHCRRDPLEMLWSCFKHDFGQTQTFTYDLGELTSFWRDSERAMHQWRHACPDWIHDHVYEDLLNDPEGRIRALLKHCGLDFDPACLAFHRNRRDVRTASAGQVRQPLRRDTAVAAAYGNLLDPLRQAIEA
jgi:tetratricopeptide (TPR) repeat protein